MVLCVKYFGKRETVCFALGVFVLEGLIESTEPFKGLRERSDFNTCLLLSSIGFHEKLQEHSRAKPKVKRRQTLLITPSTDTEMRFSCEKTYLVWWLLQRYGCVDKHRQSILMHSYLTKGARGTHIIRGGWPFPHMLQIDRVILMIKLSAYSSISPMAWEGWIGRMQRLWPKALLWCCLEASYA